MLFRSLLAALLAVPVGAQSADSLGTPALVPALVYDLADVQPEVVGGMAALAEAVDYPAAAWARDAEGTVVVQFIVTDQGEVIDPVAVRSPDRDLSVAAVDAIRQQRFTPGMVGGQPVAVRVSLPIRFRLPEEEPYLAPQLIASIPTPDGDGVYEEAEVAPELIGGPGSIRPDYPVDARRSGIQGRVIVQFVVDETGEPTDLVVVKSPHDLLAGAAVRAVQRLRFIPGTVDGRPVNVRFSLPVTFRLR